MSRVYADKVHDKLIKALTAIRKDKGLSHEALATLSGVSRPAISHIEAGKRKPTLHLCLRIAKALDVRLSDLLAKYD